MRLHRFYINQPIDTNTTVTNEDMVHQWKNVFRYGVGGQLVLWNGDGHEYLCMIARIGNREAELQVINRKKSVMPERFVGLAVSLIKKDNFEWIAEKATELGVSEIFAIISERSEKKSLNMERLRKIVREAAEQCGRGNIPTVHEPTDLEEFFESEEIEKFSTKLVFHPGEDSFNLTDIGVSALLCIGPEGGFTDREIELFRTHSFGRRSLGKLILRAETAAIAVMSLAELG